MIKIDELGRPAALALWDELGVYVGRALERDPWESTTLDEVQKQVASGYAQVLVAHEGDGDIMGAAVVQMFRLRGQRVVHVLTTAGDNVDAWLPELIEHLADIARREDSPSVTMSGRPGWAKKLTEFGFRTQHVNMRLEVADVRGIRIRQQQQQQQPAEHQQPADRAVADAIPTEPVWPGAAASE